MSKPRVKMTRTQIVEAHRILTATISVQDGGRAVYKEGWDDERVAKSIHPDITTGHIGGLRREMFGRVTAPKSDTNSKADLVRRVADLETLCAVLEREYAELKSMLKTLMARAPVPPVA